jgi:hypothetical protein
MDHWETILVTTRRAALELVENGHRQCLRLIWVLGRHSLAQIAKQSEL